MAEQQQENYGLKTPNSRNTTIFPHVNLVQTVVIVDVLLIIILHVKLSPILTEKVIFINIILIIVHLLL